MAKQLSEAQKEARRKYQADRRKNGFCNSCSNKAVEGKTRCQTCLDRAAVRAAATYQNRKKLGVCPQCKQKPAVDGGVYCADCLKYHKEKMDVRRQDDDYKAQQKVRAADWYQNNKATKKCPQCHERPAAEGSVCCEECKQYHRDRGRERTAERKRIVFAHYGTTCRCCGQEFPVEMLQIDHVDDDGAAHRKEIGQSQVYAWLIKNKFPTGFITLCGNCNFAWGHGHCCPHAKDRLVAATVDGKPVLCDPQTGKIAR